MPGFAFAHSKAWARGIAFLLALQVLFAPAAFALPSGWEVISGDVSFQNNNNILTVTSTSNQAIIQYQSFNIGAGESVHFVMPGDYASILNRILGGASIIDGGITSNGQVLLVNPAGIRFTPNANVQTAGLLASTNNLSNTNYLNNNLVLTKDDLLPRGAVMNEGLVQASGHNRGSYIVLAGSQVTNSGALIAPDGSVALAVGDKIAVNLSNHTSVEVTVDESLREKIAGSHAAINNTGGILAHNIEMEARLGEAVSGLALNVDGIAIATGLENKGGKIAIKGTSDANSAIVSTSGILAASGDSQTPVAGSVKVEGDLTLHTGYIEAVGEKGGDVQVLGSNVILADNAAIDASGQNGGGSILIGGDFQGTGTTRRAQYTSVGESVRLWADSFENGNGGKVIVWADDTTSYYGNISAIGGAQSGNGGFTEVSGHQKLNFYGNVDVTAAHGNKGTLLLDPATLTIVQWNGPTDIANLRLWLDASDVSNTGVNPAEGANVGTWVDKSGNGANATEAVAANQPVYQGAGLNGRAGLFFNQEAQGLQGNITRPAGTATTTFTYGQYNTGAWGNDRGFWEFVNGADRQFFLRQRYAGNFNDILTVGNTPVNAMISDPGGTTNAAYYENGVLINAAVRHDFDTSSPSAAYTLGDDSTGGNAFVGYISELLYYDRALTADEISLVNQHINTKWNVNQNINLATTNQLSDKYLEYMSTTGNVTLTATNGITVNNMSDNLISLTNGLSMTAGTTITFLDTNDVIRTEGGAISFTAPTSMTLGSLSTRGAAGTLNGNITLNSNGAVNYVGLAAGSGTVTFAPTTAATGVSVGGGAGAAILLTQAKINAIASAGTVQIGDTATTGTITIDSANFATPNSNVTLSTTGAIAGTATNPNISVPNNRTLTITGGAGVGAGNVGTVGTRLKTTVDDLSVRSTGTVYITETNAVDITQAITTGAGSFNLAATTGNITLANIDIAGAVDIQTNTNSTITGNTNIIFRGTTNLNTNDTTTGNITVTADFQGSTSLYGDVITVSDTAAGFTISALTTGGGSSHAINATNANGWIDITITDIGLLGGGEVTVTADKDLTIRGPGGYYGDTDTHVFNSNSGGNILFTNIVTTNTLGLTVSNTAPYSVASLAGGDWVYTNGGTVTFTNVDWAGAVAVTTANTHISGTGNIFRGTTNFNAGSALAGVDGNISFLTTDFQSGTNSFTGHAVTAVDNAGSFTVTGAVSTDTLVLQNSVNTGNITFSNVDATGVAFIQKTGVATTGDITSANNNNIFRSTAVISALGNNGSDITVTGDFQGATFLIGDRVQVTDTANAFDVDQINTGQTGLASTLTAQNGALTIDGIGLDTSAAAVQGRLDASASGDVTIDGTGWNTTDDILNVWSTGGGNMVLQDTALLTTSPLTGTVSAVNPNQAVRGIFMNTNGGSFTLTNNSVNNNTSITAADTISGTGNTFVGTTNFDAALTGPGGYSFDINITASDFQNTATNSFDGDDVTVQDNNGRLYVSNVVATGNAILSTAAAGGANRDVDLVAANITGTANINAARDIIMAGGSVTIGSTTTLTATTNITANATGAPNARSLGTITGTANGTIAITETTGNMNISSITNTSAAGTTTLQTSAGNIVGKGNAVADITSAGTGAITVTAGDAAADNTAWISGLNVSTGGNLTARAYGKDAVTNDSIVLRGSATGNLTAENGVGGTATTGDIIIGDATANLNITGTTGTRSGGETRGIGTMVGAMNVEGLRVSLQKTAAGNMQIDNVWASANSVDATTATTGPFAGGSRAVINLMAPSGSITNFGGGVHISTASATGGNIVLQAGDAPADTTSTITGLSIQTNGHLRMFAAGDTIGNDTGDSINITGNVHGYVTATGENWTFADGNVVLNANAWGWNPSRIMSNRNVTVSTTAGNIIQDNTLAFDEKSIFAYGDIALTADGSDNSWLAVGLRGYNNTSDLTVRVRGSSNTLPTGTSVSLNGYIGGNLNIRDEAGTNPTLGIVNLGNSLGGSVSNIDDTYQVFDVMGSVDILAGGAVNLYGGYNLNGTGNINITSASTITGRIDLGYLNLGGTGQLRSNQVGGTGIDIINYRQGIIATGANAIQAASSNVMLQTGNGAVAAAAQWVQANINIGAAQTLTVTAYGKNGVTGRAIDITGSGPAGINETIFGTGTCSYLGGPC